MWCDGRRPLDLPPGARIEVVRGDARCGWRGSRPSPFTDRLVAKFDLSVHGWRGAGAGRPPRPVGRVPH